MGMNEEANGKLRRSFALAGAAIVVPLLAVFAFNTLWGYLPLHRDVGAVPQFVQATNAMRDIEIAVLRSTLPLHGGYALASHAGPLISERSDDGEHAFDAQQAFEHEAAVVQERFSIARAALSNWPEVLEATNALNSEWLVVRQQGLRLVSSETGFSSALERARALREFDRLLAELVSGVEALSLTVSAAVNQRLTGESVNSQKVLGLSMAIGFMVIVFTIYVNLRLARYVVDPVNGLVGSITRFRGGDYSVRTDVRRADEIGNLADAFNIMAQDIEQTHQHLESLSERDPLTGMLNRRGFDSRFERHLKQAEAAHSELAVIMVDIDHFKKVNDTYGHAVGDQVLVAVADTIRNCLRGGDFSARFGGEEFIICLPDKARDTALAVAERMREAIARLPLQSGADQSFSITASAGVALYPTSGTTGRQLIEAGDAALYAAKNNGRNRVELAAANDFAQLQQAV